MCFSSFSGPTTPQISWILSWNLWNYEYSCNILYRNSGCFTLDAVGPACQVIVKDRRLRNIVKRCSVFNGLTTCRSFSLGKPGLFPCFSTWIDRVWWRNKTTGAVRQLGGDQDLAAVPGTSRPLGPTTDDSDIFWISLTIAYIAMCYHSHPPGRTPVVQ